MTATATPFSLVSMPYVETPPRQQTVWAGGARPLSTAREIIIRRGLTSRGDYNPAHDPNSPAYGRRDRLQAHELDATFPICSCPCCDTVMTTHQLQRTVFQTCCDNCGTSGPRRFTERMAVEACQKIFGISQIKTDEPTTAPIPAGDSPAFRQVAEEDIQFGDVREAAPLHHEVAP